MIEELKEYISNNDIKKLQKEWLEMESSKYPESSISVDEFIKKHKSKK